jgi:hypothetical protein
VLRLVIGLFGLVGILGVLAAPLVGRCVDHLLPWLAAVMATVGLIIFQAIQTGAGGVHIAAVVIVCFGLDVFRQFQQVSLNTIVFGIEPSARSRMNALLQISVRVEMLHMVLTASLTNSFLTALVGICGADHGNVRRFPGVPQVRLAASSCAIDCVVGLYNGRLTCTGTSLPTLHVVWI